MYKADLHLTIDAKNKAEALELIERFIVEGQSNLQYDNLPFPVIEFNGSVSAD